MSDAPPAASIRRRVLLDLCEALSLVAPVHRNPSAPVPEGVSTWLVVNDDGHEQSGQFAENEGMKTLTVTVEGHARGAADDDAAEALADALYCDLVRAACGTPSRGGLASDTRELSCVFAATEGENRELIGLCTVGLAIDFFVHSADPSSAP